MSASLKTIATAQADFRSNDRDGNGLSDYWRVDLAGLYALESGDQTIKLIELSIAGADKKQSSGIEKFTSHGPKAGYWFGALRLAGESEPDPNHFAACAFPDTYGSSGRWSYIISDANVMYGKDLGHGNGPDVFPEDPIAEGWEILE